MNQGMVGWSTPPSNSQSVRIERKVLSLATSPVTFYNIPSGYANLRVVWIVRGTNASAQVMRVRFNEDSAANYDQYGSGVATGQTGIRIGVATASGQTAGQANAGQFVVVEYGGITYQKMVTAGSAARADSNLYDTNGGIWHSLVPINSLSLMVDAGTFDVGSTFTLYGDA